jgi:hypothetical protein
VMYHHRSELAARVQDDHSDTGQPTEVGTSGTRGRSDGAL